MRPVFALFIALAVGCGGSERSAPALVLATTTSTRDSGLLEVLVPIFERETGIQVKVVAVGSGQALEMGRRGDADVLLTHAPEAEQQFVAQSYGLERRLVMYNDFVLLGPDSDPAGIERTDSITDAFAGIAETKSGFVSRGDVSGTHLKERSIWSESGIQPDGDWYLQAGSGMAAVLRMASEKAAYTLSDRGTFLSQRDRLDLQIVSQGDPLLKNQYAVIPVNTGRHGRGQAEAARRFADFLLSPNAQAEIAIFGVERFGEALFFPQSAEQESGPR